MNNDLYAPPQAVQQEVLTVSSNGFSDNGQLVVIKGFEPPSVCLKSGAESDLHPKLFKKLVVHTPGLFLLGWFALFIITVVIQGVLAFPVKPAALVFWGGIIVLCCLQKKVKLRFYLSKTHAKTYKRNRFIVLIMMLLAIAFIIGSIFQQRPEPALVGILVIILAYIFSKCTNRLVKKKMYRNGAFWLAKVHPNLLGKLQSYYAQPASSVPAVPPPVPNELGS